MYEDFGAEAAVRKWISVFPDKWEKQIGLLRLMGLEKEGGGAVNDENVPPTDSNANITRWLEHEMRQFTSATSLTAAALSGIPVAAREKAILMAGQQSYNAATEQPMTLGAIAAPIIAELCGKEVVKVPGGHIGYANEEFVGWFAGVVEELLG